MGEMTAQEQQAWMQAAAPNEHHETFKPMVGTWNAVVKLWMDPAGEPQEATGQMVNSMVLGGRFIEHDYKGQSFGMEFLGKGFFGFDNTAGQYEGLWIDTTSTQMQAETGNYDPATKTFNMIGEVTCPSSGETIKKRSVIRIIDDNAHTMEMFFVGPDGSEFKSMEISYTRA